MIRAAALVLLAGSAALIFLGMQALNAPSSDISRFFTGAPTDRATWMLVGGAVMLAAGIGGVLSGSRRS